jgi:L-ribulokinase
MNNYVVGIDFGTDSVRSLLVDCNTGKELASSVFDYPRWKEGLYCDPLNKQFRQHPRDHIEGLTNTVRACIRQAAVSPGDVKGIGVASTGSTPVAVGKNGNPLSMEPGFEENPNAMFVLWKDHTAIPEAVELNDHAKKFKENYLQYVGGIYSAEWYWAKLLHLLRTDKNIGEHISGFVEHCDWVPHLLAGGSDVKKIKRSVCAAGHKGLWSYDWAGLPPPEFFLSLDPLLKSSFLFSEVFTSDQAAGKLSKEWADILGLTEDTIVAVGAIDAHMGAVGGQIESGYLVRVMGTSTCDMMITEKLNFAVQGICGQVEGSIIPGMTGLEAGQSAFGDAYQWWAKTTGLPIEELTKEAEKIILTEDSELAIDWLNGRRTPDADQSLKAGFINLTLASTPARLFRAVVEATCFGGRAIIERFEQENLPVKGLIGIGGISLKSSFVMQMLSDITKLTIKVNASEQSGALGAAMFAATASDQFKNIQEAMNRMGKGFVKCYEPNEDREALYNKRYKTYQSFGRFISSEIT